MTSASRVNSPSTDSLYDLVENLTERLQGGEVVDLPAVLAAHPEHADRLRQVFPALEILADLQSAASSRSAPPARPRMTSDAVHGVLGDFRIVREIGRGGMGVVYEAEQISLDRRVALKILPFAGVLDARQLQRFKNEARAAAGLHHPNIVPVYAVGCERGVHFYAMQYVEGQTLAEVIHALCLWRADDVSRLGGTALAPALIAVTESDEMTNDEIQMSKEIRNPKSEVHDASASGVIPDDCPSILGLSSATNDLPVAPAASATNPGVNTPGSPGSHKSPRSPDASTLRLFDTSTPSHVRFRTIAEWAIQVAEALDYAHSVGVIHRDIKPANLMLDTQGRVWITDFGLAQVETDAGLTMTGDIVGTLRYMSPEQALGDRGLVDQRTDVYSLGITLYELLTLEPAFGQSHRRELLCRIASDDPISPRRINPAIPVELDTIVQKAIEKDPRARYATARELADDLRRFLNEQSIKARPATRLDKCKKWIRRNPLLVRASVAFVAVALVAVTVGEILIDHERQQTRLEQQARGAEQEVAGVVLKNLRNHQRVSNYVTAINLAANDREVLGTASARHHLRDLFPQHREEDLRSFEWHYLWNATRRVPPAFAGHEGHAYSVRLSPDCRTLASAGQDGVRIWDYAAGAQIEHLTAHNGDVNSAAFSPDGDLLVTAGDDQTAKIWSTRDWKLRQTIPHVGLVVAAAFSPDGRLLATGERHYDDTAGKIVGEDVVRLWETRTWEPRPELRGHSSSLQALTISDDGNFLASSSSDDTACIWDLATGALLHRLPPASSKGMHKGVNCVAFAHHRPLLATVGRNSGVRLWQLTDGALLSTLSDRIYPSDCVAFSPDDSTIVAVGRDPRLHLWQMQPDGSYGAAQVFYPGDHSWSVAFVDNESFVTSGRDGVVQRWERSRTPDRYQIILPVTSAAPDISFSDDDQFLATTARDIRVFDLILRMQSAEIPAPGPPIKSVAFAPDGKTLASGDATGHMTFWDRATGQAVREIQMGNEPIMRLEYLSNGNILVARVGGDTRFLDTMTHNFIPSPISDALPGELCFLSPRWKIAALFRQNGDLQVRNGDRLLWSVPVTVRRGVAHAFSLDGSHFAVSCEDNTIHIWNTADAQSEFGFVGHLPPIDALAFSPDGKTLAGCGSDGRVKLWNLATGRELLRLESGLHGVRRLSFSPQGSALAISGLGVSGHGEVIVWQTGSDE